MGAAMAVSMGIGAVGGISKWVEGRKMQRNAQNAINNFKWQELKNPYKDLSVSTMSADLQREEAARAFATASDSIRSAGTRAVGVGAGRLLQNSTEMNRQIGADLDRQQKQIDYAAAQDDTRIRDLVERRQAEELAGYGQQLNVGMNMKYGAYADLMNLGMAGAMGGQQMAAMGGAAGAGAGTGAMPPNLQGVDWGGMNWGAMTR